MSKGQNDAAVRLRVHLSAARGRKLAFARSIGVSPSAVTTWTRGRNIPRPDARQKIFELSGIEPAAWFQPAPPSSFDELYELETEQQLLRKKLAIDALLVVHRERRAAMANPEPGNDTTPEATARVDTK